MAEDQPPPRPAAKPHYRSVVEGVELANEFTRSRLTVAEFARQRGVSQRMVQYWTQRARQLAVAASGDLVQVAEVSATGVVAPIAMPPAPVPSYLSSRGG